MRNRRLAGLKFRRQHPLGLYIADFYSASAQVIELDGDTHATGEGIEHDRVREVYLRALGVEVIRFWNSQVKDNPDGIVQRVFELCTQREATRRLRTPKLHRRERTVPETGTETP